MDQLSRRDAVYRQVDQLSAALRPAGSSPSAGQSRESSNGMQNQGSTSFNIRPIPISSRSSSTVGSPPMSPVRSLSSGPLEYLNRVGSSLAGALQNSPLNGASESLSPRSNNTRLASPYASLGPMPPPEARLRTRRASGADLQADQLDSVHGLQSATQSEESLLPDYTPGSLPASAAVKYAHSIASSSGKIEATLESVGSKQHPVYVSGVCHTVSGNVRLRLQGDENAHELRIRVKGVATTTVLRTQHNNARSIAEEEEFWYAGCTLWTAQTEGKKSAPSTPEYQDFPFSITIPTKVQPSSRRKAYPMPPSFILASTRIFDSGGIESASIRYYVKITLARKGLLRQNERLFAPIVYLTRADDLSFLSNARRQALVHGDPLPGPAEAPDSWLGRVEEKSFKKGFFSGKKAGYKVAILLPAPLIYGKTEKLPYFIRVESSDSSIMQKVDTTAVQVQLVQRCVVISHGAPGLQENVVAEGSVRPAEEDNPAESETTRRFSGDLSLSKAPATSFQSYNIEISYHLTCRILGQTITGDNMTIIPINVVSIPPIARAASDSRRQPAVAGIADLYDLPPSYFEVVEQDNMR